VLHEHCLHHLIAWTTLGRKDEDAYWNELFHAYGRRGSRLAEMRERDIGSEYQQFVLPLNRRLIARSLGLIVHNRYAESQLEGAEGKPVEVVPHHLSPGCSSSMTWMFLNVGDLWESEDDALVIGSFGFVTQSKRIPTLLTVFKRLLALKPNARCLIVGEDHWKWSVAPVIAEMGLQNHVQITGYADEEKFFRYLKAVDIVVNLRYPTAGETSGTLIRSLGMGKPSSSLNTASSENCRKTPASRYRQGTNEEHELYLRPASPDLPSGPASKNRGACQDMGSRALQRRTVCRALPRIRRTDHRPAAKTTLQRRRLFCRWSLNTVSHLDRARARGSAALSRRILRQ
jgi:hypothetical protein